MDSFKKSIKLKMILLITFNIIACIFIAFINYYSTKLNLFANTSKIASGRIQGFQTGFFVGLELLFVLGIIRYRKALNSNDELKKLYIEENDERKKHILSKTSSSSSTVSLILIAFLTIISGFFNEIVFYTLVMVLFLLSFIKVGFKLYYLKKC
ncbi:hypothetical protein [Clostridium ihumii]|uniref:hypothetical protein n=1 Tax=Clostridium ihumii TaxID=1470356 RepID=UPI000684D5D4|nr:hypothetical protein [Clostridium ihumii]